MRREGRGNNNKTAKQTNNKQKFPLKPKNDFAAPWLREWPLWFEGILLKQARRFENLLWVKLGSMIWDD